MKSTDHNANLPHVLIALKTEPDGARAISDRLQLTAMGPADHIRTKHEIKQFILTGDLAAAETLIRRANERRSHWRTANHSMNQSRGFRNSP